MSSSSTTHPLPPVAFRQDASLIGLVGLAHMVSHFSQLLLAPLFPWLKDAFNVSYAELGFLMTIFFVVSCAVQTASGFVVDRVGPRPVLFAGLAFLGLCIVSAALFLGLASFARAEQPRSSAIHTQVPATANDLAPTIYNKNKKVWPKIPRRRVR